MTERARSQQDDVPNPIGESEKTTTIHHRGDPWTRVASLRGFAADELISALQKHIRRGNLEEAILVAREMYESSEELEEKAWQRLTVSSCEDAGDGTYMQPVVVDTLYRNHLRMMRGGDRWLFLAHATRYLCEQSKDRTTDELCMWALQMLNSGARLPEIPDYALDVHTRAGQERGRGFTHFLDEGSRIENRLHYDDSVYLERIKEIVRAGEWAG